MATKNIDLTVRAGRTVVVGEPQTGADGKPAAPKKTTYGPGATLSLPAEDAERLIKDGSVARAGSEEARAAVRLTDTIPANFPHADLLAKNGIETFSALSAVEDLEDLDGVGPAKAAEIQKALDARS